MGNVRLRITMSLDGFVAGPNRSAVHPLPSGASRGRLCAGAATDGAGSLRSREIGVAVAKLLAALGDARVTLVARSEAKLREAVAQLPGAGHDFIAADLSEPEGIDLVAKRLAARHYD
jgi:hypothetical protein